MANSRSIWFGMSLESVRGTPSTSVKTFVPVEQGGGFEDDVKLIEPNETRGSRAKNTQAIQGTRSYKGKQKGVIYDNATLPLLIATFGKYSVTQPDVTNAPNAWEYDISLEDVTPKAFTAFEDVWQETANQVDRYAWMVVNKLDLKFVVGEGLLEWDGDLLAMKKSKLTGPRPTPDWTDAPPYVGWAAVVEKGNAVFDTLTDFSCSISNGYQPFKGSDGTDEATRMLPGDFSVTGKSTVLATRAQYEALEQGAEDPWAFTFNGPILGGTVRRKIKLYLPRIRYKTYTKDRSKAEIMLKLDMTALYDRTEQSPAKLTVVTDVDPADL